MKCSNCGAFVPEGNLFCTRCGAKAEIVQQPRRQAPERVPYPGGNLCPSCGASMPEGYAFCTKCGSAMTGAQGAAAPAPSANIVCWSCGAAVPAENRFCTACGANLDALPTGTQKKKKGHTGVWIALICVLLAAAAAFAALFFTGALDDMLGIDREDTEARDDRDRDDADEEDRESKERADEAAAEEEEDAESPEESEEPEPSPSESPAPAASVEGDVKIAVNNYLTAFIQDVNAGQYSQLYSYVQSGSSMESVQKDFINKGGQRDLRESLLDSQIESVSMQSESTYHVTVLETYEIRENADPYHWWIKQRCTYQVNRQSDGSWKIAGFVGSIQTVDKGNY